MQTLNIKTNEVNFFENSNLSKNDYTLLMKEGKPLGLFTSFDNGILQNGLTKWLFLKAYKNGDMSIGQLAKYLKLELEETFNFLAALNIPIVDYDLTDDLETINDWNKSK